MNKTTLDELKAKQKGKIISMNISSKLDQRMLDMGVTKGAVVEVIKVAPLGDPIEIKVRGYMLSLRKNEASDIVVDLI